MRPVNPSAPSPTSWRPAPTTSSSSPRSAVDQTSSTPTTPTSSSTSTPRTASWSCGHWCTWNSARTLPRPPPRGYPTHPRERGASSSGRLLRWFPLARGRERGSGGEGCKLPNHAQRQPGRAPADFCGRKIGESGDVAGAVVLAVRDVFDAEERHPVECTDLSIGRRLHVLAEGGVAAVQHVEPIVRLRPDVRRDHGATVDLGRAIGNGFRPEKVTRPRFRLVRRGGRFGNLQQARIGGEIGRHEGLAGDL